MTRRRTRRTARAIAGLASLLALAALIAGLPAALYAVSGSPIPHAIPAWHQITSTLGRPDHGALLLAAIRWVSWLAWAAFTVSAMVEVFSQARGRAAPRLPAITPVQGFAAALVGTAILGLLPGSHLPRPVPSLPRPAPAAATAPPRPGQPAWADAATRDPLRFTTTLRATPHRPTYTVAEGDNLWDIAARQLGDPQRWREIFELNCGRPQPDGRTLGNPNLIYPGWILTLPSRPAVTAGPARPPAPSPQPSRPAEHPPVPHQAGRAGAHTGRAISHPPLPDHHARPAHPAPHVSMHHGRRERPAGVHLPGGGLVGVTLAAALSAALVTWRLHRRRTAVPRWPIPAERAEPPVPEAISTLRRAHLRSLAADAAEARGEPWPDEAEPGEAGSSGWGETDDDGLDEFGAPAGRTTRQPASPASGDGQHLTSPWPAGRRVTTMAAADSAVAGPLSAPVPAPAVTPATGSGRDRRAGGSPPGEARWRPAPPARPLPAGTVVFGTRGSTEISLSDVARLGLGLTGPGAHAAARALMIGLLAAPARSGQPQAEAVIPAADARQLTAGHQATAQMPGVAPGFPDGLTISPTLTAALDRIETEITRRLRLQETGDDSPASPGTPDVGHAEPAPLALIASVDPPTAPRVRAMLDAGASAGIVCVVLGDWAAGTTCHIGADGVVLAATDPALAGVHAGHLPAADAAAMLSLLRGAQGHLTGQGPGPAQPPARGPDAAMDPEPGRTPQPGAGSHTGAGSGDDSVHEDGTGQRPDGQQPAGQVAHHDLAQHAPRPTATPLAGGTPAGNSDAAPQFPAPAAATPGTATRPGSGKTVVISVLGPVRIAAGGGEIRGGLRKARELLAYLAVQPEGVTGEGVSADLWPESSPRYAASQRKLALRKAREMLRTATGLPAPLFIILAGERYRLDTALIEVDLWQFAAALDRAQAAAGQDQLAALQQAAALYQGPLADGAGYEWAERYAEPTRRRAVDALARIAGILQPHDPEQALTVLETAVAHDPYNEAVYQEIMRIQGRLGRPDAARRTLALLETRLAGLGLSLTATTRQAAGIPASDLPQPSHPAPAVRQGSRPSPGGKPAGR
jgi:DNA-binding SARP family transcriptional activator